MNCGVRENLDTIVTTMTPWTPSSQPIDCPRCHMQVTPAMPQFHVGGRALHRECYIAWHFSQTGRYPRRLGHARPERTQGLQ